MKKRDTKLVVRWIFPIRRSTGVIKFNSYIYSEETGKVIC